jgi:hypothetical protein
MLMLAVDESNGPPSGPKDGNPQEGSHTCHNKGQDQPGLSVLTRAQPFVSLRTILLSLPLRLGERSRKGPPWPRTEGRGPSQAVRSGWIA